MESDCCGAYSDCSDDIDICPACGEHADWNNQEEEEEQRKWVVLNKKTPIALECTLEEARKLMNENKNYTIIYDEYYQFNPLKQN